MCASVRFSIIVGDSSGYERTNFVQKRWLDCAREMEIRATVQSCAKVQNSCAHNLLIYKCKHSFCTNVLFFPLIIGGKEKK